MDASTHLAGRTRETKIRRDARGRWFDGDHALEHPKLTQAFDRWLERAPDGRFCLKNDINWAYVEVEGPARFVRGVRSDGQGLRLTLDNDTEVALEPEALVADPEGVLHQRLPERMVARFESGATVALAEWLGERLREADSGIVLDLEGGPYRVPVVDDPLASQR